MVSEFSFLSLAPSLMALGDICPVGKVIATQECRP